MIEIFCVLTMLIFVSLIFISVVISVVISSYIITTCIYSYLFPILKPYFLTGEYGIMISEWSILICLWLAIGSILGLGSILKELK